MCGIAGFLGFGGEYVATLKAMIAAMRHRGPDAQNQWISEDHCVALGHARLSVVDLSATGAQPMTSHSARYVIAYNGEIYNHLDIRRMLDANGDAPIWRGSSDTETLLAAFDSWGVEETLQKCIGMFALAIWDQSECTLSLTRDRFGEKPLYYQPSGTGVIFASELASMKQHPECSQAVSQRAIRHLAESRCIPAPLSIYEGVFKLLPGTLITFTQEVGFLSTFQWWSPFYTALANVNSWDGSEADALVELEEILKKCVERQMIADVPLGAFLSGGIDSSLIVALMQNDSSKPINTFTIGFSQQSFDEAQYAKKVAQHLGTHHTEHYVTDKEISDLIPKVPSIYSEPFADSSQLPTFLVSRLARQEVTVALSGDAGDEIFAGYTRHTFTRNHWKKIQKIPSSLRKVAAAIIQLPTESQLDRLFGSLPMTSDWTRVGEKLKRSSYAMSAKSLEELHRYFTRLEHSDHVLGAVDALPDVLGPQSQLLSSMADTIDECAQQLDPMRWLMVKDQSDYLTNDILAKVDRAAMACSLETRAPFLDHTLVEFSQGLPSAMLVDGNKGKMPLRKILAKHVPDKLFERPKMGFAIPVHTMLKTDLRDWAEAQLSYSAIRNAGAFDADKVSSLWQEHLSGRRDNISKLWPVLMYQAWHEAST